MRKSWALLAAELPREKTMADLAGLGLTPAGYICISLLPSISPSYIHSAHNSSLPTCYCVSWRRRGPGPGAGADGRCSAGGAAGADAAGRGRGGQAGAAALHPIVLRARGAAGISAAGGCPPFLCLECLLLSFVR